MIPLRLCLDNRTMGAGVEGNNERVCLTTSLCKVKFLAAEKFNLAEKF